MVQHVRAHERRGREHLGYTAPPVQVRAYDRRGNTSAPYIPARSVPKVRQRGPIFKFGGLEVSGELRNEGVKFPFSDPHDTMLHNQFRVTVYSPESGVYQNFDWYDSNQSYMEGKDWTDDDDLADALGSILMDGNSGYMGIDDFASEFGFNDLPPSRLMSIYNATRRSTDKLEKLGLDGDRMIELQNALSEWQSDEYERERKENRP